MNVDFEETQLKCCFLSSCLLFQFDESQTSLNYALHTCSMKLFLQQTFDEGPWSTEVPLVDGAAGAAAAGH